MQTSYPVIAISLTGLFCVVTQGVVSQHYRPNVILIVADDHGKDGLGCYGNPVVRTPNLDELAARGVRFERAYCTSASSSASRAVILTGKFGHTIGHYGHEHTYHHFRTFEREKSLPVYLSEAGYKTARIGKYHLAPETVYKFDQVIPSNARNTVEMAERCRPLFEIDEPFFLYFCTDDPHRDTDYLDLPYRPNSFGNRINGYEQVEDMVFNPDEVIVPPFLTDNRETRAELAQYYRSINRLDQGIGHLIDLLRQSGKYDSTLIIYIADNGIAMPGAKTTLYEPGIQLPCIVKPPCFESSKGVSFSPVSWIDITPTILDYCEIKVEDMFGESFRKAVKSPETLFEKTIFAAHTFHEVTMYYPMRAIISDNYKLIVNFQHKSAFPFASDLWYSPTFQSVARYATSEKRRAQLPPERLSKGAVEFKDEQAVRLVFEDVTKSRLKLGKRHLQAFSYRPFIELYDLEKDPNEINNLATKSRYNEVLVSLKSQLKNMQEDTNDPWFSKWEYE